MGLVYIDLSQIQINFVPKNHEWKMIWILRRRLDEELVPPRVQCSECVRSSDIVYENAAISTVIKRHSQTLKAFLASSVPNLQNTDNADNQYADIFLAGLEKNRF